jgi:hypothetical protein
MKRGQVSFPPPAAQIVSVCAGLCAGLCAQYCHSPIFLRADRLLAPIFSGIKKLWTKTGATGFKSPLSIRKKLFLVSSCVVVSPIILLGNGPLFAEHADAQEVIEQICACEGFPIEGKATRRKLAWPAIKKLKCS